MFCIDNSRDRINAISIKVLLTPFIAWNMLTCLSLPARAQTPYRLVKRLLEGANVVEVNLKHYEPLRMPNDKPVTVGSSGVAALSGHGNPIVMDRSPVLEDSQDARIAPN